MMNLKRTLIPAMMLLATISSMYSGNKTIKIAAAEDTASSDVSNKSKKVEKGFTTKNLVSSGMVGLIDDTKTKFENNFTEIKAQKKLYDDSFFKSILEPYGNTILAHRSDGYVIRTDYDNTKWQNTSYVLKNSSQGVDKATLERFVHIKYGLDYCFEDWDKEKEQPLELAIKIDLDDIETGINACYPFYEFPTVESLRPSEDFTDTIPIISINGYDYFTAQVHWDFSTGFPRKTVTYHSNNARAYISYTKSGYAGYVFLEIPFTSYLQSISVASYIKVANGQPSQYPGLARSVYVLNDAYKSGFKAPIVISDLDFKKGTTTTITSNSVYVDSNNTESIEAVDSNFVRLDSLVIDNKYTLYAKRTGEHPTPAEDLYELYTDSDYKNRFTYDSDNELANKLQEAKDNVKVTISKYNYSILKKETETSSEYATTADFVDCGNFYAFKKINKDQIHTVTFNALKDTGRGSMVDRLAFSAYDNTTNLKITKISAIMFYYSFYYNYDPHYDNGKVYNLSISAQDLIDGGVESGNKEVFWHWFKDSTGNIIHKKDKFGTQFFLTGLKKSDYKYFNWDGASDEIKKADKSDMFLIGNKGINGVRVTFESIISCVYIDKNGDLINCSSIFPNGINAPTAIIDDDGNVTLVDFNGNVIPGTVNPDTGVIVMPDGNPYEPPDNIEDTKPTNIPTNILDKLKKTIDKIMSSLSTIVVVGGVLLVISAVGPTIVAIFKKKE